MSLPRLTPTTLRAGEAHIAVADAVMRQLMQTHPRCALARDKPPFHTLMMSIINQQLSQKAATAIGRRVAAIIPAPFIAADVARLTTTELRAAGLSGAKANYLHALAAAGLAGQLEKSTLQRLTDEEVIAHLTAIIGVGRWTAEMFLMLGLRRADVLSPGDAGLRRAVRQLYGKRFRGNDAQVLEKAAHKWKPYRTIGCWHLWRSLDN